MARRMFSPNIVSSDAFIDMPISTQALYFHLGMNADDDGFVNPKRVMRMIGISDDDLKILVSKRFVLPFENGVVVIKHWRINNLVRKDWYRPTIYVEQKNLLFIKENGAYTDDCTQGECLVNEFVNVGKDRIGKDINSKTEVLQITSKKKEMRTYNESDHSDNDMPSIDLETGELPVKEKKEPKNKLALEIQKLFILMAKKTTGVAPIKDTKGYFVIINALKYLTRKQVIDLFRDWFGSGRPDNELVSITRALSHNNINKFKIENGITN